MMGRRKSFFKFYVNAKNTYRLGCNRCPLASWLSIARCLLPRYRGQPRCYSSRAADWRFPSGDRCHKWPQSPPIDKPSITLLGSMTVTKVHIYIFVACDKTAYYCAMQLAALFPVVAVRLWLPLSYGKTDRRRATQNRPTTVSSKAPPDRFPASSNSTIIYTSGTVHH